MFFDDEKLVIRKHARLKQLPPVPETGWRVPSEFPNLAGANFVSFDVETKELDFDNGPGWARNQGHIIGLSIGARDNAGNTGSWYFPVRHEVEPELNLNPSNVFGFAKEVLGSQVPKIGANITYDMGWLAEEGVTVRGPLHDVQFAEALIDSDAYVALDILGHKYTGAGKASATVERWCREAYPNTPPSKWRGDLWRASPRLVGPYAEGDSTLPIEVMFQQAPILAREQLEYVYRLECDLIPLMIKMRQEGVTVNIAEAQIMLAELRAETKLLYQRVFYEYGYNITGSGSGQLGGLFKHVGVETPLTKDGNPSIRKEWLAGLEHPLGDLVNEIREHEKMCGTFIEGYILGKSIPINGSNSLAKIYPQFHQMKNDENGTVVGRYSSSDPNLQNIPSRTTLGKRVRTMFTFDQGHFRWSKFDYSQIHYRILANYAVGPGSDELRSRYVDNPKTDYHQDVYNNVAPRIGWSLTDEAVVKQKRRVIKNVNFSLLYGVGRKSLAYKYLTGMSPKQVDDFFDNYYEGAPYVKPTMEAIAKEVQEFGFVTTVLGRRIRFNLWEPIKKDWENPQMPLPYRSAISEWGSGIKRAYDYRGVNYKFQGSEPDIMKHGMRECHQSGVFDVTGVPRLTVHDELDFSERDDTPQTQEAFAFIKHTMQNTIKLRVPINVDRSTGPNWGKAD